MRVQNQTAWGCAGMIAAALIVWAAPAWADEPNETGPDAPRRAVVLPVTPTWTTGTGVSLVPGRMPIVRTGGLAPWQPGGGFLAVGSLLPGARIGTAVQGLDVFDANDAIISILFGAVALGALVAVIVIDAVGHRKLGGGAAPQARARAGSLQLAVAPLGDPTRGVDGAVLLTALRF